MRSRLVVWVWIWLGWTALALFFATSLWLNYIARGQPANFRASLLVSLSEWWIWALLTPVVVWLARRWPIQRPWSLRNLFLHGAAGAVLATVKVLLERVVRIWIFGVAPYFLPSNLALHFLVYWAIVLLTMAEAYHRRSRQRELQAAEVEARLNEARLQLLQAQLQPHFLFNALNTIAETVHEDPDAADRMIAALGDLLRATLDGEGQTVPLSEELSLAEKYLAIQQARFGERLRVEIDVPRAALAARVPRLLLQPLLENAIHHGLGSASNGGRIRVAASADGSTLRLEIHDNGQGFPVDGDAKFGVGLTNTRARLEAMYSGAARFEVDAERPRGARVRISLPFESGHSEIR